jgi:Flp pilus assembly protein TadG
MAAVLMIFLLGMIAFAVDMGWIVLSETELQHAADAAALAGAEQLMNGAVLYSLPNNAANQPTIIANAVAGARTAAKNYASYNAAGGVNSLVLNDGDIQFGFTDAQGNFTAMASPPTVFPNTIKVLMRRDDQANGSLSLFFARVLGIRNTNLAATASSTIYAYSYNQTTNPTGGVINSFSAPPLTGVLPMTYDVNAWNKFLKTGQAPDGSTSLDANGNPQLPIYPNNNGPGNFGQLSLDASHAGESYESGWVDNGMSSSDLQGLINAGLIPLSQHDNTKWDWVGDTGMKQSLVSTINSYAGKTFLLPILNPIVGDPNDPINDVAGVGQGSNYYYQVVQFVSVKIMPGASGSITVQPAPTVADQYTILNGNSSQVQLVPAGATPVSNLSASSGSPQPSWQQSTIFATPKLTQ